MKTPINPIVETIDKCSNSVCDERREGGGANKWKEPS